MMPQNGKNGSPRSVTPLDLKTIISAKEVKAAALRKKHCSDTAIDAVWNDPQKRIEFFWIRKEIKELNNQLASMA
jgi:hypothetical protein